MAPSKRARTEPTDPQPVSVEDRAAMRHATINDLDAPLLVRVFGFVPLQSRARATSVCKAWLALKREHDLWCDVPTPSYGKGLAHVARILAWLPDKGKLVRSLSLHSTKGDDCNVLKRLIVQPNALASIGLDGPKITAAVVKLLNKHAPTLETLIFDGDAKDKALGPELFAALASHMPALRTLVIPHGLLVRSTDPKYTAFSNVPVTFSGAGTGTFFEALAHARHGRGPPPLEELRINASRNGRYGSSSWTVLRDLGRLLPSLRVLHLGDIADLQDAERLDPFASYRQVSIRPMPNLRELVLCAEHKYIAGAYAMSTAHHGFTTVQLRALLGAVFTAAPSLRIFRLTAPHDDLSGTAVKLGCVKMPLATLGNSLIVHPPPRTLEVLELGHLIVQRADCVGVDLPALQALSLPSCEGDVAGAREQLSAGRALKQPLRSGARSAGVL